MPITPTKLSFEILPTNECKTLAIADTSVYNGVPEGATLQVSVPDKDDVIELVFTVGGVTVLNSNALQYSKVNDLSYLLPLPDGLYTFKISVCPYDIFWYEKDFYRTCQLECKYYKALLELDLVNCQKCYSKERLEKLQLAWLYIQGIWANTNNGDINKASSLYKSADSILTALLECDDCK